MNCTVLKEQLFRREIILDFCNGQDILRYILENTIMMKKKYERYYGLAGKASYENWEVVKGSGTCGCYYCCSIFSSKKVTDADWVPDLHGRTVLCPRCGIDAVIGDVSGIPIRKDVLEELHEEKFCKRQIPEQ